MTSKSDSVGIVQPHNVTFQEGLRLHSGEVLAPVTLRYETYGKLSPSGNNAILIEHALSGDAHAAGYYADCDGRPGWWDSMIGPGKPFDTNRYFIVCSNILGGCSGSTGPGSLNPATGKPYGMDFPVITIEDMVDAQRKLKEHLGIKKWMSVAGGSMGGMQAIQWGIKYPDEMDSVIAIATTARISAQSIAFNWVSREAIMDDVNWHNGNYTEQPEHGLATARMLAHITYLSEESMRKKFGRRLQSSEAYSYAFKKDFSVESYLEHQGSRFVERFDANSYLYITRAIDYFDVAGRHDGELWKAFQNVSCPFMVVSFSSDWLFPPAQSRELVKALIENDIDTTYCNIESSYGHDAFLLEEETLGKMLSGFLGNIYEKREDAK